MANEQLRIGDRERDEAVELLQEHMTAGRLTSDEFNDRMSTALEARTWSDLHVLFTDLPGRRPGQTEESVKPFAAPEPPAGGVMTPATYGAFQPEAAVHHHQRPPTPWYAQWWLILVAVAVTAMSRGEVGFLIPAVAMWVWLIAPALTKERQRRHRAVAAPPRPLTFDEREELIAEINVGRPIEAIRRYRYLTGADLYTAKVMVESLRREIGR